MDSSSWTGNISDLGSIQTTGVNPNLSNTFKWNINPETFGNNSTDLVDALKNFSWQSTGDGSISLQEPGKVLILFEADIVTYIYRGDEELFPICMDILKERYDKEWYANGEKEIAKDIIDNNSLEEAYWFLEKRSKEGQAHEKICITTAKK